MSRRNTLIAVGFVLIALSVGAVAMLGDVGGSEVEMGGSSEGGDASHGSEDELEPAPGESAYELLPKVQPAKLVRDALGPASSNVIDPVVNAWSAGNHRGITSVDAGLAGDDRSGTTGRFVIWHIEVFTDRPPKETTELVDVPGSGALEITDAPLGREVVGWAPRRAEIRFTSEDGVSGTLHLRGASVTLD